MNKVIPSAEHTRHQHHWLVSERASHPCISEWIQDEWYSAGETNPISPEEMHRRGWRYGAPALPPQTLLDQM